jgi:hypothetical protein
MPYKSREKKRLILWERERRDWISAGTRLRVSQPAKILEPNGLSRQDFRAVRERRV